MKHRRRLSVAVVALVALAYGTSSQAQQGVSVNVYPSIGPNGSASPNNQGYNYNAISALYGAVGGNPADFLSLVAGPGTEANAPSAYSTTNATSTASIVATPFNSWNGVAGAAAPFDGEFGNHAYFGVALVAPIGAQISLADVSYSIGENPLSAGPNSFADLGGLLALGAYGSNAVGVSYGADGLPGGAGANADSFITAGADTQLVDAILYRGIFDGITPAGVPGVPSGTNQGDIDLTVAEFGSRLLTGNYSIAQSYVGGVGNGPGSGGFGSADLTITIPEPGSLALVATGLLGAAAWRRRNRRTA